MNKKASELITDANSQYRKLPNQKPHPEDIARLQIVTQLAVAQSNTELAAAITALTEAAAKQGASLKDLVGGIATQLSKH
jgi:hypothetical protein